MSEAMKGARTMKFENFCRQSEPDTNHIPCACAQGRTVTYLLLPIKYVRSELTCGVYIHQIWSAAFA